MPDTHPWAISRPLALPNPGLALLVDSDGLWTGGLGGVARYADDTGWTLRSPGLSVRPVYALAAGGGYVFAGGEGGIARSPDRGDTWQPARLPAGTTPITAIALSPAFADDGTVLAATLGSGILRSTDAGLNWQPSNFGLSTQEVFAIAWTTSELAFAATSGGIYRSPNGARAWRSCPGTEDTVFTTLVALHSGAVLAGPETGPPLRSDDGASWSPVAGPPSDLTAWALIVSPSGRTFLGSRDHGIWRSDQSGRDWIHFADDNAVALVASELFVYAGTPEGVSGGDDKGETWSALPPLPLHDLRHLLVVDGRPVLSGINSSPESCGVDGVWSPLPLPPPITGLFPAPGGVICAAGPAGLFRSDDYGTTWLEVSDVATGITQMTFLPDGRGWAGLTPDAALLRTADGGLTWERLVAPFGILSLIALAAFPAVPPSCRPAVSLVAATYDPRLAAVTLWRSDDEGENWHRGGDTVTDWPIVATCQIPPTITVANVITVQQPDGSWIKTPVGNTGIRRVVSDGKILFALAGDALWRSDNLGATWERDESDLPADRVSDIALDAGRLFAFVVPDTVWERSQ